MDIVKYFYSNIECVEFGLGFLSRIVAFILSFNTSSEWTTSPSCRTALGKLDQLLPNEPRDYSQLFKYTQQHTACFTENSN